MNILKALQKTKPTSVKACGYAIEALSADEFFAIVFGIEDMIAPALAEIAPDGDTSAILAGLLSRDAKVAVAALLSAGKAASDLLYAVLARATRIPEAELRSNKAIGPVGLAEIASAALKANRFEDFFSSALPVIRRVWQGMKSAKSPGEEAQSA